MDAADWVDDPGHRHSAQLLQVDLYDEEAAAPVLDDEAFYAACRAVLADGGVMSVNLFGRDASFERSLGRIAEVFGAGTRVQPAARHAKATPWCRLARRGDAGARRAARARRRISTRVLAPGACRRASGCACCGRSHRSPPLPSLHRTPPPHDHDHHTTPRRPPGDTDTLAVPHQVWKGKLDWKLLLGWLRDDKLISAEDSERIVQRFGAGVSSQHALVRLGAAGLMHTGTPACCWTPKR